jgi:hypothetical protein
MNPSSHSRSGGGRDAPPAANEVDTKGKQTAPNASPSRTPGSDMQSEDAGTPASGTGGRGTAAESVMKQEHKTANESGSRR